MDSARCGFAAADVQLADGQQGRRGFAAAGVERDAVRGVGCVPFEGEGTALGGDGVEEGEEGDCEEH